MYKLPEIQNRDSLFLSLIHIISEEFKEHAILKGGMVLRLFGSKRETIDLDYTFIPYQSKKDIMGDIKDLFSKIEGLDNVIIKTHSKMIRVIVTVNNIDVQIEINVATDLKTDIVSTASLKNATNSPISRIIKIMSLDVALAHKLAAWNERRLIRDLYDIFYLYDVQTILPDMAILSTRLANYNSRIPKLKKIKTMPKNEFLKQLKKEIDSIDQKILDEELSEILDANEIAGLSMRMKDSINRLISSIKNS